MCSDLAQLGLALLILLVVLRQFRDHRRIITIILFYSALAELGQSTIFVFPYCAKCSTILVGTFSAGGTKMVDAEGLEPSTSAM